MKKSKIISAIAAAALALTNLAAFASFSASAEEVNLDGAYHAYIGVQSASYTFRNAYDDATYGYGVTAEDGTVWFDQLTGWDGATPVNKPTTFVDAEIAGNGTYTVSMSDFDFGEDQTLNLLFVSTDIPLNETIKFSDVKVKMDGSTKYTFDEAFMDPDATIMMKILALNIWNGDLGGEEGLFGYTMPANSIDVEFTVSGFNYDKAAEETTAEVTEAAEETTTEAITEAAAEETTAVAAETEAVTTEAAETSAPASNNNTMIIIIVIAAVVVVGGVIFVVAKKKS